MTLFSLHFYTSSFYTLIIMVTFSCQRSLFCSFGPGLDLNIWNLKINELSSHKSNFPLFFLMHDETFPAEI